MKRRALSETIRKRIAFLYPTQAEEVTIQLEQLLKKFQLSRARKNEQNSSLFSEKDVMLIAYADHVWTKKEHSLKTLKKFLQRYVKGYINRLHILPFFPYSSDDGFSVIDYYQVKKEYGNWRDVLSLAKDFRLMFDLVINHVSSQSVAFQKFLSNHRKYYNYFISYDQQVDTSSVFRPRINPLLTPFDVANRKKYVWTTFSADQIDLNFSNPQVLLDMIKVLLFYTNKGASAIRIDAIAFLWKQLGTVSVHLPQTHEVVKLLHDILALIASDTWLITETNVPHTENISYFGNGSDEANLVYNFTLSPLLLYSIVHKDTIILQKWAKNLQTPSKKTAFFNFTATHDGIGVTGLKGIVPDEQIIKLAKYIETKQHAKVNYRAVAGAAPFPYELNCVYVNATGSVPAFLATQAIALAFKGVPGIYFNSLIGATNWQEGVKATGANRAINRQKFDYPTLVKELENPRTQKHTIYHAYIHLLQARINEPLFHPQVAQEVVFIGKEVFALLRFTNEKKLLALTSFSDKQIRLSTSKLATLLKSSTTKDILSGKEYDFTQQQTFLLSPYATVWLKERE